MCTHIGARRGTMKTRLLVIAMWVSTVFGAVRLVDGPATRVGATAGVIAGIVIGIGSLVVFTVRTVRARVNRLRSWPRPGEVELPTGPRRVLLIETGLGRPE